MPKGGSKDDESSTGSNGSAGAAERRMDWSLRPPLKRLGYDEVVRALWNDPDSVINTLIDCLRVHLDHDNTNDARVLKELQTLADNYATSNRQGITHIRENMVRVRAILRQLVPTPYAYHHAAADLIHLYLTTHTFFSITSYSPFRSSPIDIPIIQSHGHHGSGSGTKTKGDDHGTLTSHANGTTSMTVRGKQYYAGNILLQTSSPNAGASECTK
jgi:hypothetical protein